MGFMEHLEASLRKGFIDYKTPSSARFRPRLLVNNQENSENVLNSLLEELDQCESFLFSVAFVTESGLAMLKSHLWDLKRKGIKGRILTSTYLSFNQPKVFKELMKIENAEVRLTALSGFHAKGYIFQQKNHYSMVVGSSNLTANALKVNYEWNVKLTSHENGDIIHHFKNQFEQVWAEAAPLSDEWITNYEKQYNMANMPELSKVVEFPAAYQVNPLEKALQIKPNRMQEQALSQIQALRDAGEKRGLVISATGTGKTFLSAFDVRHFSPGRMLFIVHREQILQKAKQEYQRILGGPEDDFGILSGSQKDVNARYLFATVQTLSKQAVLQQFDKGEFDYILVDEVHKAGAASYLKVLDYFSPQFLLGMTATPERTDDFNIFELFDYNIAYEIRLQEALEEDMLCPFHYFGVTDIEMDNEHLDEVAILNKLTEVERINHILDKLNYYGYSGSQVKGLMFCSRTEETHRLSEELNSRGLRTAALSGRDSLDVREKRIRELEKGELDYILTVDVFNEGIDIPCVNQIVMLRQTQSNIVFIQQLGRGLRKHEQKEYVTVIDFIGNYKNNYLIPVALSGDQSMDKDRIRRYTKDTSYIKGISTVNFEEIAKQKIYQAISQNNIADLRKLREAYFAMKNRLGRIPVLYDFVQQHSLSPLVIVNSKKFTTYYDFLLKMEKNIPALTDYEHQVLRMVSLEILNGKRKHEILLLGLLLIHGKVSEQKYFRILEENGCITKKETMESVLRLFSLDFFTKNDKQKYGNLPIIIKQDGNLSWNEDLASRINHQPYFKEHLIDVWRTAEELSKFYSNSQELTLYQKYTRKDACKLLNWKSDESSTMYGYKPKYHTCPIFITYHKHVEVDASVNYGDEFLNQEVLRYFTKNNRTLASEEVQKIVYAKEKGYDLHIFVKKDDDEGSDFYYLGKALPDTSTARETTMPDKTGKQLPVVTLHLLMEEPIEYKLYEYLTEPE